MHKSELGVTKLTLSFFPGLYWHLRVGRHCDVVLLVCVGVFFRYELTAESRAHINFKEQRQFGSLWKLLSELPDEPGVVPEEFMNQMPLEPKKKK